MSKLQIHAATCVCAAICANVHVCAHTWIQDPEWAGQKSYERQMWPARSSGKCSGRTCCIGEVKNLWKSAPVTPASQASKRSKARTVTQRTGKGKMERRRSQHKHTPCSIKCLYKKPVQWLAVARQ